MYYYAEGPTIIVYTEDAVLKSCRSLIKPSTNSLEMFSISYVCHVDYMNYCCFGFILVLNLSCVDVDEDALLSIDQLTQLKYLNLYSTELSLSTLQAIRYVL